VRHYMLTRLYLGWHAIVSALFGLELIVAPRGLISGPSTVTVFGLRPPWQWGLMFGALAVVCLAGVRWPLYAWRPALLALIVVQVCWAIALTAPLFTTGRANLLAPAPWVALAVTSIIIGRYTEAQERSTAGRG